MERHELEQSVELLRSLVAALGRTYWSSWQTIAPFVKELEAAEDFLRAHPTGI